MSGDYIRSETGELSHSKLPWNGGVRINLNEQTPWVAELLSELAEEVEDEVGMVGEEKIYLNLDMSLEKKRHQEYGEIILAQGEIATHFPTLCSSTGVVMIDDLKTEFNACFLPEKFKKDVSDPMEEEIELSVGDRVYDLFFYPPRGANFKEMIHEMIFLNKNPYPRAQTNPSEA